MSGRKATISVRANLTATTKATSEAPENTYTQATEVVNPAGNEAAAVA